MEENCSGKLPCLGRVFDWVKIGYQKRKGVQDNFETSNGLVVFYESTSWPIYWDGGIKSELPNGPINKIDR